jgi:hypothetical protein
MKFNSIKVGAQTYSIETFERDFADDARRWGDTDPSKNKMRICDDLPNTNFAEVEIHEICHAILYDAGMPWVGAEVEDAIGKVSPRIAAFVRDNPKFVKHLVDVLANDAKP